MFDNSRDCIAIALMALGYDINTTDASQITEAVDLLVKQKSRMASCRLMLWIRSSTK